jgi:hypothetical protein
MHKNPSSWYDTHLTENDVVDDVDQYLTDDSSRNSGVNPSYRGGVDTYDSGYKNNENGTRFGVEMGPSD